MLTLVSFAIVMIALLVPPTRASAQTVPSAAVHALAPDVVRLRDGTRLRGTVAEYRPGAGVTLLTVSGEVRVIAPGDVAEVIRLDAPRLRTSTEGSGVVSSAPRMSSAPLRVRFDARGEGTLTVYVATGVRARARVRDDPLSQLGVAYDRHPPPQGFQVFERLCTAPCARTISAGDYEIGLALEGALPIPAGRLSLRASTGVRLAYDSAEAQRTTGAVIFFASFLGLPTLGLLAAAFGPDEAFRIAGFVSGIVAGLLGAVIGLIVMGTASDTAGVSVAAERP